MLSSTLRRASKRTFCNMSKQSHEEAVRQQLVEINKKLDGIQKENNKVELKRLELIDGAIYIGGSAIVAIAFIFKVF